MGIWLNNKKSSKKATFFIKYEFSKIFENSQKCLDKPYSCDIIGRCRMIFYRIMGQGLDVF